MSVFKRQSLLLAVFIGILALSCPAFACGEDKDSEPDGSGDAVRLCGEDKDSEPDGPGDAVRLCGEDKNGGEDSGDPAPSLLCGEDQDGKQGEGEGEGEGEGKS